MFNFKNLFSRIIEFYSEKKSTDITSEPVEIRQTSFNQKGNSILDTNGWKKQTNYWFHPSYPDFKIIEKSSAYEITPNNKKYKIIKIDNVENLLKKIKEYNVYLNSKKKIISKDSFLSDFE